MTNVRAVGWVAVAAVAGAVLGAASAQAEPVELVTVVGCLAQESGDLPWILERATDGVAAKTAFTSQDELETSAAQALGSLEYRLLGVGEFGVEPHVGHKVQVKGLKLKYDGEWRLNVTSFQHLDPNCQ